MKTNFELGDVVEFCEQKYLVISNHGTSGVVAEYSFGETGDVVKFSWEFEGELAKKVTRTEQSVKDASRVMFRLQQ